MKIKNILIKISKSREIGVLIPLIIMIITFGSINRSFFILQNIIDMLHATSYIFW